MCARKSSASRSPSGPMSADWQYARTTSGSKNSGTNRSRNSGWAESSDSAIQIRSPVARISPFNHWWKVLPLFFSLTTICDRHRRVPGPFAVATSTLSSGDASSRKMISCGRSVWSKMLWMRSSR